MEEYRTEEEQVEALKKWWQENGRSTIAAIIVALGVGFGWQGWKNHQQTETEAASNSYQQLLRSLDEAQTTDDAAPAISQGAQIKADYSGTTYAQFAALHLARLAVEKGNLRTAEAELRWALERADSGSDVAHVAGLRLARVLASSDKPDEALAILQRSDVGAYKGSYASARGDVLLSLGRSEEAKEAYSEALALGAQLAGQNDLILLQQKLQSLSGIPAGEMSATGIVDTVVTDEE